MMIPTFRIAQWAAQSTRLTTPEHWHAWAHGQLDPFSLPECKPDLAFLPALQRRRLSLAARLMFQAAYQVVGEQTCPTILVSHDGELNRSFELWQTLLREHSVSPTSFGLSVHNALVGQWSMLHGDTHEHTALAAQEDGWELAILEATALLTEGQQRVLVIAVEDPLTNNIPLTVQRAPFPYAIAMLLEHGKQWTINHHPTPISNQSSHYWGALTWLQHILLSHHHFSNPYSHHLWQWQNTH